MSEPSPEPQPQPEPQPEPSPEPQPEPSAVGREEFERLVAANKKLIEERDTFKEGLKAKELEQMKASQQWQEIAELKEKEAMEARAESDNIKKALVTREKMSAIKTAAMASGIRAEALDDLDLFDFPEVQIETTNLGNIKILGAKEAVDSLKVRKPYLFGKKSGNLNTDLPTVVDGGKVTIDQIMKAEEKARKSGKAEDMASYSKLTQQYNQQQRGN